MSVDEEFGSIRSIKRQISLFVLTIAVLFSFPQKGFSYPNGPVNYVTDIAPYCAACHASTNARKQIPEKDSAFVDNWTVRAKHFTMIEKAPQYKDLTPEAKKQLIKDIATVDTNASIKIEAPSKAKSGELIKIKVTAVGGSGPVVGIALLDNDTRFQSRPVSSSGWYIEGAPDVKGPPKPEDKSVDWKKQAEKWGVTGDEWKKKEKEWDKWKDYQTDWTDQRIKTLDSNLNFVLVYGITADLAAKKFSTSEVTWTVRTPMKSGSYSIAAAFFYGTEKASPIGTIKKVGYNDPKGGFGGGSGRIMMSDPVTIKIE